MKQSNNKKVKICYASDLGVRYFEKDRDKTAFIYVRISREDDLEAESYSIQNQIKLLIQLTQEYGYTVLVIFMDDGITGVIAKDLSRLYRNRTEADKLNDDFLPEHEVRLVSVGDGIDTATGDDEFIFLRNWANEQYARDISKKRRLSNKVRGNAGEPLSLPPYGYRKDSDNPKRWIIDEEAATVVRRIYSMTLDGYGAEQIAAALDKDRILTPIHYWRTKGINRAGRTSEYPYKWNSSTVVKMLTTQEYCGDVIKFKTYSKSSKLKKRLKNDEENMAIFRDVHEPIIDRADFEKIQKKRGTTRKRKTGDGEKNMFSGLLICADCGSNMNFHFNQKNPEIRYFNRANNNSTRKTCPTTHYIRVDFLEEVLLKEIRRLTKFASRYENEFVKMVMGHSQNAVNTQRQEQQKELDKLLARDRELDSLFNRMYEDNVSGKIDDERFVRISRSYTEEQSVTAEKVKTLRSELEKTEEKSTDSSVFISAVRKYTRAKKLTPRMLTELVERLEVHRSFPIDVPDILPLPAPEVVMQTRKGVAVSYSHSQNTINL